MSRSGPLTPLSQTVHATRWPRNHQRRPAQMKISLRSQIRMKDKNGDKRRRTYESRHKTAVNSFDTILRIKEPGGDVCRSKVWLDIGDGVDNQKPVCFLLTRCSF